MEKAAILYDFDKTLCTKDMQEYSLIPRLGYENAGIFWDEVTELTVRNKMDGISAYLYHLQRKFAEQGTPLTKEMFTTTCASCGAEAKVPFKPREDRPVYCSECFSKMKAE